MPFWRNLFKLISHGQKVKATRRLLPSTSPRHQLQVKGKAGLGSFRNTFLSSLRQRAQSRIYRYLVNRQSRKQQHKQRHNLNTRLLAGLGSGRRRIQPRSPSQHVSGPETRNMAYSGQGRGSAYSEYNREPGARRKKLAGYLKAANDVRRDYVQSYFGADGADSGRRGPEDGPGAFPDAAVVRSGNEEMILFPSYARRHIKGQVRTRPTSPDHELTEQEYWQLEWDKEEDNRAVVDVDVRGWVYTPHIGQNTRKQRLFIGLARQLSGIPAPPATRPSGSGSSSRASSPSGSFRVTKQEEDLISFEADQIVRKGQQEEKYADRGAFSERPKQTADTESIYGNDGAERGRASYASTISSQSSDSGTVTPIKSRTSWQPDRMTHAELVVANTHLLNRLRPFMANPLANSPITAFFYNSEESRSITIETDASGHFTFRAALAFIPTHVRVLAGEKLSATEEVVVTHPKGVSLISDIDDTVKHSAISAGAREIFRNAFTRELGELTIDGVREWYTTLHEMGVKMHYVSNAPWQMYPVLTSYFKLANLPKGSFHLKQYSGMLQGIFEPVAERKKSSLDKLMRDFPERKFIFVGDSGEADLEVYTETALDNPGRVLGIFIRDVTTTVKTGYFDSNNSPAGGSKSRSREHSRNPSGNSFAKSKRLSRPNDIHNDDADLKAALAASLVDMEEDARKARRSINPDAPSHEAPWRSNNTSTKAARSEENLIDFSDPVPAKPWIETPMQKPRPSQKDIKNAQTPSPSPPPPPKPAVLRSPPPEGSSKAPPPVPRKPSSAVQSTLQAPAQGQTHNPSPLSQVTRQNSARKPAPPLPSRPPRGYREMAKDTIAKGRTTAGTYWHTDAAQTQSRPRSCHSQPSSPLSRPASFFRSVEDLQLPEASNGRVMAPPPPPPARRNMTSSTAHPASQRYSGAGWDENEASSPGEAGVSKKEFLWKQRWERAKGPLERNGVTLRSWRVGEDVAHIATKLVEAELRRIEKEEKMRGVGKGGL